MPTEMRTKSAGNSRNAPTSGGTLACDTHPGRLMVELMLPKLTQMLNMRAASTILRDNSFDRVVKLSTAPAPRACLRCNRYPGEVVSPGYFTEVTCGCASRNSAMGGGVCLRPRRRPVPAWGTHGHWHSGGVRHNSVKSL